MPETIQLFPIPLAIRLLLDSVSFSNALPYWVHPLVIDYSGREDRVRQALKRYLGGETPDKAMEIPVPKKDGNSNVWLIPSVNDQIALQASVSAVAEVIEQRSLDKSTVFSCRLNKDPKRLAFLDNQIDGWKQFNSRVQDRCALDRCVLQFDIRSAYESIEFDAFVKFLHKATDGHPASGIIERLLTAFSGTRPGLPFINDSVFFLGNAYFSEVDRILRARNYDFIRFVDDYRVFGSSTSTLEGVLSAIRPELRALGFELNESKLKLGTGEEYLQAMSKVKFAEVAATDYHDASVQDGIFDPKSLFDQVMACLKNPDDNLHQGFGRMLLSNLRTTQYRVAFAQAQGSEQGGEDTFNGLLAHNSDALKLIAQRLDQYSEAPGETWRLVWTLYICKDVDQATIEDQALRSHIAESIEKN